MIVYDYWSLHSSNTTYPAGKTLLMSLYTARDLLLSFYPAALILFGFPSNIVSIIILSRKSVREHILSALLTCLFTLNLLVLVLAVSQHWYYAHFWKSFRYASPLACWYSLLAVLYPVALCNWVHAMIKWYRILSVFFPARFSKFFLQTRHVLTFITLVVLLLCSHWLILNRVLYYKRDRTTEIVVCSLGPPGSYLPVLYLLACLYTPCLSVLTVQCVIGRSRRRHALPKPRPSAQPVVASSVYLIRLVHLTDVLLLVCVLPITVLNIVANILALFPPSSDMEEAFISLCHTVAVMCLYTCHAGPLVMYAMDQERFRSEVGKTLALICNLPPCLFGSETSSTSNLSQLSPSVTVDEKKHELKPVVHNVLLSPSAKTGWFQTRSRDPMVDRKWGHQDGTTISIIPLSLTLNSTKRKKLEDDLMPENDLQSTRILVRQTHSASSI